MSYCCYLQAKLSAITSDQKDQLLEKVMLRLPGLMFDALDFLEPDPIPETPAHGQPQWCTCTNCREMPTDLERKCCRQRPENCVSRSAYMDLYVLDEGVLRLARAAWNDIFAVDEDQEPGVEHQQYRHTAYRQFVLWQYGRLGEGNRVVIPSCTVWRIRDSFPDAHGHYTGYIPRRLN